MDYPGRLSSLTDDMIIAHYKKSGFVPTNKSSMNGMMREHLLQLKETRAFYLNLIARGKFKDDGGVAVLDKLIIELEGYVDGLEKFNYT